MGGITLREVLLHILAELQYDTPPRGPRVVGFLETNRPPLPATLRGVTPWCDMGDKLWPGPKRERKHEKTMINTNVPNKIIVFSTGYNHTWSKTLKSLIKG